MCLVTSITISLKCSHLKFLCFVGQFLLLLNCDQITFALKGSIYIVGSAVIHDAI